jgi:hypothetical protein
MTDDVQGDNQVIPNWPVFFPWEEDELLATYVIPHIEAVARTRNWLWHEGRCYFGLAPQEDDTVDSSPSPS